jgi:putative transposase
MSLRESGTPGEWYHCYNRGVDKRTTFSSRQDYERFMVGMYAANSVATLHASDLWRSSFSEIFSNEAVHKKRGETLIDIGAFALMSNHFHILIREKEEGGMSRFMQKLTTGYTMFYNKKHGRSGALFAGAFKSRHVSDDAYLKQVVSYIHLNPAEKVEPLWKEGRGNKARVEQYVTSYPYSSLPYFVSRFHLDTKAHGKEKSQNYVSGALSEYRHIERIVSERIFETFETFETLPSVRTMVSDAWDYYNERGDEYVSR